MTNRYNNWWLIYSWDGCKPVLEIWAALNLGATSSIGFSFCSDTFSMPVGKYFRKCFLLLLLQWHVFYLLSTVLWNFLIGGHWKAAVYEWFSYMSSCTQGDGQKPLNCTPPCDLHSCQIEMIYGNFDLFLNLNLSTEVESSALTHHVTQRTSPKLRLDSRYSALSYIVRWSFFWQYGFWVELHKMLNSLHINRSPLYVLIKKKKISLAF